MVLCQFVTHEEVEFILNDFHSEACNGLLSGIATT